MRTEDQFKIATKLRSLIADTDKYKDLLRKASSHLKDYEDQIEPIELLRFLEGYPCVQMAFPDGCSLAYAIADICIEAYADGRCDTEACNIISKFVERHSKKAKSLFAYGFGYSFYAYARAYQNAPVYLVNLNTRDTNIKRKDLFNESNKYIYGYDMFNYRTVEDLRGIYNLLYRPSFTYKGDAIEIEQQGCIPASLTEFITEGYGRHIHSTPLRFVDHELIEHYNNEIKIAEIKIKELLDINKT